MAKLITFKEIDSTSNYIKRHINDLNNMTFVRALHQTDGKGRGEHKWISDNNNLLFSFLLKNIKLNNPSVLSIVVGVALAKTLAKYHMNDIAIKWPNDIFVKGKKILGILLEGQLPNYIIVGIGINVNQTIFNGLNATSLSLELNKQININKFYKLVRKNIKKELRNFIHNKSDYYHYFVDHDYLLNKKVSFKKNNSLKNGIALGLNQDGSYLIRHNDKNYSILSDEINEIKID